MIELIPDQSQLKRVIVQWDKQQDLLYGRSKSNTQEMKKQTHTKIMEDIEDITCIQFPKETEIKKKNGNRI